MSDVKIMDLFGGERHENDEALDTLPPIKYPAAIYVVFDFRS